jgi:hypothetical protein
VRPAASSWSARSCVRTGPAPLRSLTRPVAHATPDPACRPARSGLVVGSIERRGAAARGSAAPVAQAPRMRSAARSPMTIAGRWCARG